MLDFYTLIGNEVNEVNLIDILDSAAKAPHPLSPLIDWALPLFMHR